MLNEFKNKFTLLARKNTLTAIAYISQRWRVFTLGAVALVVALTAGLFLTGRQLEPFEKLSTGFSTPDQYLELASRYKESRQFTDAEAAYTAAINLEPALQLAAYAALAHLYTQELPEKGDNMERLYLRGITYNPRSRVLMQGLAHYYEIAGRKEQALQWYQKIVAFYPQDQTSRLKLIELQTVE